MKLTAFFTKIFAIGLIIILAGCSVNLSKANLEGIPLTTEKYSFFGNIPMTLGNDTIQLSQDLLRAYTAAASPEIYSREKCRGVAAIKANIVKNQKKSAAIIGAAFIPFWPIMPVDETWSYNLNASIYCNGTLVKHVEFTEEDRIKAVLYGRLRSGMVNKASKEMHRKLVQRLTYELGTNRPADQNSASDF